MAETVKLHLKSPSGDEDIVEVEAELWEKFERRAAELNVTVQDLFVAALDDFLTKQGYD